MTTMFIDFLMKKVILLAQGYNGKFSHTGINVLDFNMKEEDNILVAKVAF